MSALPPLPLPASVREIQETEVARIFGRFLTLRLFGTPLIAGLAVFVMTLDPAPWRRWLLGGLVVGMLVLSVTELRRFRRQGLRPGAVAANVAAVTVAQVLVVLATGGMHSPFLPALVPVAMLTAVLTEGTPARWPLHALQVSLVWGCALVGLFQVIPDLPLEWLDPGGRRLQTHPSTWVYATLATAVLLVAARAGALLRRSFDHMVVRVLRGQEEALRLHSEQAAALTSLSGEIAHELKNPLASVKGLAALLHRDIPAGKAAERLQVLRREVDRMQGILDEFLNFSRPLGPLSLEPVRLLSLGQEVAALHEGMARDRDVVIDVRGDAHATARCDARKALQILINLVQNAIEGGARHVTLQTMHSGGGQATMVVSDDGPGVPPEALGRIFDPGYTTRPSGSGLGLTIARSLAHQHGGRLDPLPSPPGGGFRIALVLPTGGPPSGPEGPSPDPAPADSAAVRA